MGIGGALPANFSTITAIREALRVPAGTPDSLPRMPAASATAKVGRNFRRLTCAFFLSRECTDLWPDKVAFVEKTAVPAA